MGHKLCISSLADQISQAFEEGESEHGHCQLRRRCMWYAKPEGRLVKGYCHHIVLQCYCHL